MNSKSLLWFVLLALTGGSLFLLHANMKDSDPAPTPVPAAGEQLATFGGGCFWCLDSVYRVLDGVKSVTSGYAGGSPANPTYEEVCNGTTGHAEVIQIVFDPKRISYEKLLEVLWTVHNPTTLNQQGADVGTQYRSIILWHDEAQKSAAEKSMAQEQKHLAAPIVTQIVPLKKFWPAEVYHQDYFNKNPMSGYCRFSIPPKLSKVEKKFAEQIAK